jgi:tetratricopeptide (TPR) repeat protein
MKRHLILVALLATSANADVWQRAIDPDAGIDVYDSLMTKGDDAAIAANSASINLAQTEKQIDIAVEAYRAAAKAKPSSGEPWFRIGVLLNSFYFDCEDLGGLTSLPPTCGKRRGDLKRDKRAVDTVEAWDKFEALAPLDSRVNEILLQRAILRTKLVTLLPKTSTKTLLEGAAKDYQGLLDRADGVWFQTHSQGGRVLVLGNLAETYMMLGDIDKAIETYVAAKKAGARSSTLYGLAVALDRDERPTEAMQLIRSLGLDAYQDFRLEFKKQRVFFVPDGEEEYYFALCDEAFGEGDDAIEHWKAFLTSGAHPQFHPRAKEHLDRLLARKNLRWKVPLAPDNPSDFPRRLRK